MKRYVYILATLLSGLLLSIPANASHIMGGELTYTWLGGNDYRFELNYYRDCQGITASATMSLQIQSASCGISTFLTLTQVAGTGQEITPVCSGVLTTCNGGAAMGFQKYSYEGTTTLASCSDWIFYILDCCRNGSITNLNNASSYGIWIQATLDNSNFAFNNSPSFASDPVLLLNAGTSQTINNGAFDTDGDSISISLAPALDNAGNPIPYNAGFSYLSPVTTATPISVNPVTGDIIMDPTQPEVDVIVYKVEEFRNGQLISTISRDIQAIVMNNVNQLPSLTGVNGTGNYYTNICAGDTLRFTVASTDPDATDSTRLTTSLPTGMNATVTSFGGQQDSIQIEWVTDSSMISSHPYLVYITVQDNACPYNGRQTYAVQVWVNACSQDVWPGDANSDLTVNLYDYLSIGLGYNATGPVRSGASLTWVAQPSTDWGQTFLSGVDYKHADCNGDGLIDANDTIAINTNFGQTHPLRLAPPVTEESINNLYLIASRDSAGPSDTFSVQTVLGSTINPVGSIYGIAYRLHFNSLVVDSARSVLQFNPSPLGTPGNDLLTFVKPNWTAGFIDAVAVRTDHFNTSSDSTISLFDVVIIDNVSARTSCNFWLSDIRGVLANGEIQFFNPVDDSVSVNTSPVGISSPDISGAVSLYPNPSASEVLLNSAQSFIGKLIVRDLSGNECLSLQKYSSGQRIDVRSLPAGLYTIEVLTVNGFIRKKLSIFR